MTTGCKLYSIELTEALHRNQTALARLNLVSITILEKLTCEISTNKTRLTYTIDNSRRLRPMPAAEAPIDAKS